MQTDTSIVLRQQGSSAWSYGLVAAGAAAVANVAVFLVGSALGVPFQVPAFGQPGTTQAINAVAVVIATVIPLAIGTAAAALLTPRLRNGFLKLQVLAGILTVLSLGAPINAANGATVVWLAAMHLIAGVAFILGLQRAKKGGTA
jgi:hypothetical protein